MKLKNRYLGLQFFAEGDPPIDDTTPPADPTLTQDQVNDIIAKRLAKEKAKWEKDFSTKLETEKAEATRLANLDAEQRKEEEYKKKLKTIEEREAAIKLQESKMETSKVLKDRGLSESFVDFVIGVDNETTLININTLEKAFKDAVKSEVDTRLPSADPPASSNGSKGIMTKDEFKKLPLHKQNELYIKEPEKYKELFK